MVEEVAEHSVLLVQMADQEAVVLEGRGHHLLLLEAAAILQVHPHPKEITVVQVFLTEQHGVSAVAVAVLGQQQPMYHRREQRQEMAVTEQHRLFQELP